MLFNSIPFLILVLVTFLLFYSKFLGNFQTYVLVASSIAFYSYGQPLLLMLLLSSASVNAVTSYLIAHRAGRFSPKLVAIIGVAFNLLVLAFFKYNRLFGDFFGDMIASESLAHLVINLPLPIGISFYTFQGISLLVDVFRGEERTTGHVSARFSNHFLNTVFFITFFPQLVAGPIVKAHDFFPQIRKKFLHEIDWDKVVHCLIMGYFLKVVIADNLSDQTFWITYPYFESKSTAYLLALLFAYSMQIFADFAGYSFIAIGVAALLGYQLPQNFNYPYISKSIAEFWRRWHMSLSSWLKEYLYFSLGGNRRGSVRTYVNLILVMFIGGMWHGAAISYGAWGLWHGAGLAIERFLANKVRLPTHWISSVFQGLFVFSFATFGWLLFKLTNFSEAVLYLRAIYGNVGLRVNFAPIVVILIYSLPVVLLHLIYLVRTTPIGAHIGRTRVIYQSTMMYLILVNQGPSNAFVYFQF